MKKNRGSIFLITIFIVVFLFVCLEFVLIHIKLGSLGTRAKIDSVQSSYCTESILNSFLARDDSIQKIKLLHQKKSKLVLPVSISMEQMTSSSLNLFPLKNSYGNAVAYASCTYRGIPSGKSLNFQYIHNAYLQKDGIVDSYDLIQKEAEEMRTSLLEQERLMQTQLNSVLLNGDYYLGTVNGKMCFYEEKWIKKEEQRIKEKVIYRNYEPKSFIFLEAGSLTIDPNINVDAIFYVKGRLILQDSRIFGVLILNAQGSLEGNGKVEGYVLNLYDKSLSIPVKLARQQLDLYMDVLPNFIKLKVVSMEKDT